MVDNRDRLLEGLKNGDKYEGDFVKNRIEGYGKYEWADLDMYEGSFKDGKKDGRGTFFWKNGDTFKGVFKDGNILYGDHKYSNKVKKKSKSNK